jgi:hypothetical protein
VAEQEHDLPPEDDDETALFARMLKALDSIKVIVKKIVAKFDPPPRGSPGPGTTALDQRALIRRDKVYESTAGPPEKRQRRPLLGTGAPVSPGVVPGECIPRHPEYSNTAPRASRVGGQP